MIFGPVDVAKAEGAILAHSARLPDGRKLRKGRFLSDRDIRDLRDAGETQITVARLEAQDVHEDDAAETLARAFVPDPAAQGLDLTRPFTGRVNLLAAGPGVVHIDVAAIEAVNRIHPMITIATVPPFQQMHPGGMVATIKIISYAVPAAALASACALARQGLRLHRPVVASAGLIVSKISGGAGDKGWHSIAERTRAFGVDLPPPLCVAHEVQALAEALRGTDAELLLILTGSATSDPYDVAPEAVRAAGGQVDRFGMPVDPGNLLFIGVLEGKKVIGLPGCARSPALNGADWVMARVMCGVPVSDDDISGMGVGGLLKEIPSRPQPRRGRSRTKG